MARPGRERALVDGEVFDRGFFECAAEAGERVAVVEVVEVAFVFARVAGDVEAGFRAGAGEGDVAPFLEACLAGAEDEGALDGEALAGVAGERVGVADVAGLEVAGGSSSTVGPRSVAIVSVRVFAVDAFDGAAGAVLDAEAVVSCGGRRCGRRRRTRVPAMVSAVVAEAAVGCP